MLATALQHAAEAWPGVDEIAQWLRERAEHIESTSLYEGEVAKIR